MAQANHPGGVAEAQRARSAKVRPFDKGELPQVIELYTAVFGALGARAFQARWRWSQEENSVPQETRRWVLVDGPRVVGFLATVPQRFRVAGRNVLVHDSCDYMVHPDYRFHGIALMRQYFRDCENCISLDDMPATIAVLKMMKARPVDNAVRYVRMLDARAARERVPQLAAIPEVAFLPATWLLSAYDAGQAALFLPRVVEIKSFDARFDRFFEQTLGPSSISLVRDSAYLSWRYGPQSPHAARTIGVVEGAAGEIEGYVVTCTSQSQEDRSGYIFELHARPDSPAELFRALLTFAGRRIRREGGRVARLHWLKSVTRAPREILGANHFAKRTHQQVLLAKFRDESLDAKVRNPAAWNYSFGDAEASHSVGV